MRSSAFLHSIAIAVATFASVAHAQSRPRIARANETYVLIEGPKSATLEMQVGSEFRKVCAAPCDRPFAIGQTYRIAGEDVHTSETFALQGTPGSTTVLHVNDSRHHTGSLVTQGGVLVTLVGGLLFVGGAFGSCSENDLGGACEDYRWLTVTGGALAAIGVATIVTGIVLMANGSHAVIDQNPSEPQAATSGKPTNQAFSPDFVKEKPLLPASPTSPIFSFSF